MRQHFPLAPSTLFRDFQLNKSPIAFEAGVAGEAGEAGGGRIGLSSLRFKIG